jgi:hypothetical protein
VVCEKEIKDGQKQGKIVYKREVNARRFRTLARIVKVPDLMQALRLSTRRIVAIDSGLQAYRNLASAHVSLLIKKICRAV